MKKFIAIFVVLATLLLTVGCQQAQEKTICPSCGENVFATKYCGECGHPLSAEHSNDESKATEVVESEEPMQTEEPEPVGTEGLEFFPLPDGTYAVSGGKAVYSEEIIIPSKYNGASVTRIAPKAFYDFDNLKNIIIPDSITMIDKEAFWSCNGLVEVTIPSSVTEIGQNAFRNCTSLINVTIPNSVTSIGAYAFASCERFTEIVIPDSITSIDECVFFNCSNLTNITIPNSVTSIGAYVFQNCSSLTSITIPDSVTFIDKEAFYGLAGTKEKFESIYPNGRYQCFFTKYIVHCSNGTIE